MNEKQPWRPPLAPKPSPASLPAPSAQGRDSSPAVRGASLAFSPNSIKPAPATQSPRSSAALAAAAAGKARHRQVGGDGIPARAAVSPVRGRSQLTLDLDKAARKLQSSSTSANIGSAPLSRTTSEIAARAASANTSPVRSPISMEVSDSARGRQGRDNGNNALRGATVSMSTSPSSTARSPFSNSQGKLNMNKIPSLAPSSSASAGSSPTQIPPSTSTSAAQTASAGVETRLKEAAQTSNISIYRADAGKMLQKAPSGLSLPPGTAVTKPLSTSQGGAIQKQLTGDGIPRSKSPTKRLLLVPATPRPRKTSPRPRTPGLSPKDDKGRLTANSLADAMVASSLASSRVHSRAPSPARSKPPPVPHRRSRSLNARDSRSPPEKPSLKPMPIRPMRQTLRKNSPKGGEDDDTKRGRKHLLRKHPNMHHEGDRKRWRDKITERERKRYEGVWAANRGLLHQHETTDLVRHPPKGTLPEDLVLNVVVKDIWGRSRLPRDVLEEIWDLVTDDESKWLNREEFVVGMWLIDQRLKGRKLPVKVSPSVWSSVRHTRGVKISSKPL